MTDYVTVVAVDNGADQPPSTQRHLNATSETSGDADAAAADSQFITVLSINENEKSRQPIESNTTPTPITATEAVTVYRLPGERLGFGLKFQGGTRSTEPIQRLFIQSCAADSPASRAQTSWGHLREGDEIVEIDGTAVQRLTRLECVRCLKESQLAIQLTVRNGEGRTFGAPSNGGPATNGSTGEGATTVVGAAERKVNGVPPKPPPVPPRKINRRKGMTSKAGPAIGTSAAGDKKIGASEHLLLKQAMLANEKSFTPPPDAEFYINLFSDENDSKLRAGSESDDTASTISTVVDNFSLSSSTDLTTLNSAAIQIMSTATVASSDALPAQPATTPANVSSPSADLAKVLNSFAMLEKEFSVSTAAAEPAAATATAANVQQKLGECLTTRLQPPASFQDASYENVTIKTTNGPPSADYENVIVNVVAAAPKTPPTPLPRTTTASTTSTTSNTSSVEVKSPPSLIPIPRTKVTQTKTPPANASASSELPRLIHFLPKVVSTTPAVNANSQPSITINNTVVPSTPIGKCIRLPDNGDSAAVDNYADSSSSSDEDEEKSYDPHAQRVVVGGAGGGEVVISTNNTVTTANDSTSDTATTSDDDEEEDDGHEDGEKLGPPSIVNGPGPSEVYFNFPWSTNMLPTIGEVEEEFSSLEQQTTAEAKRPHKPTSPIEAITTTNHSDPAATLIISLPCSAEAIDAVDSHTETITNITDDNTSTADGNNNETIVVTGVDHKSAAAAEPSNFNTPSPPPSPSPSASTTTTTNATDDNVDGVHNNGHCNADNQTADQCAIVGEASAAAAVANPICLDHSEAIAVAVCAPIDDNATAAIADVTKNIESDDAHVDSVIAANETTTSTSSSISPSSNSNATATIVATAPIASIRTAMPTVKPQPAAPLNVIGATSSAPRQQRPPPPSPPSTHLQRQPLTTPTPPLLTPSLPRPTGVGESAPDAGLGRTSPNGAAVDSEKNCAATRVPSKFPVITTTAMEEKASQTAKGPEKPPVEEIVLNPLDKATKFPEPQPDYTDRIVMIDLQEDAGPPINNMDSIASVLALTSSSSPAAAAAQQQQHKQQQQYPNQSSQTSQPPPSLQTSTPPRTSVAKTSSSGEAVPHHRGLPPTFSRLPPDGHEFPPNFSEPHIVTPLLKHTAATDDLRAVKISDDAPPLPKSGPPSPPAYATGTRKVYRQDLVISVEDTRHTATAPTASNSTTDTGAMVVQSAKKTWSAAVLEDKTVRKEIMITAKNGHITTNGDAHHHSSSPTAASATAQPLNGSGADHRRRSIEQHDAFKKFDAPRKQIGALPTNWRKDEKSEKSVRDKIAMFSVEAQLAAGVDVTDATALQPSMGSMPTRKALSSYALNRSTENLLSSACGGGHHNPQSLDSSPFSHHKKAQSVEHLDELMSTASLGGTASRYGSSYDYAAYMADTVNGGYSSATASATKKMPSKAFSVENLHQSYAAYRSEAPPATPKAINGNSTNGNTIPASYASLPRTKPPTVARTTSFSGASPGTSYEDRRRSSINSLLEQRKKSMSKLRGLIIPEKSAIGPGSGGGPVLHDLPEIRSNSSAQSEQQQHQQQYNSRAYESCNNNHQAASATPSKQREPVVANPKHYTPTYQTISSAVSPANDLNTGYKSIFGSGSLLRSSVSNNSANGMPKRPTTTAAIIPSTPLMSSPSPATAAFTMPPIKPPRTSLILAGSRSSSDSQKSYAALDDSDSDSVFSSKVSSPPGSPIVRAPPGGKFALTRTLSSETNTSIASSTTSTLTSGSGSQASCSSVGSSTPTVDMSRKISKSSSNESYVNRKNILALAKCRSGKDEQGAYGGGGGIHQHHHQQQQMLPPQLQQLGMRPHQQRRGYEDEDSTDGYDEDEQLRLRHAPKPKQRSAAVGNGSSSGGVGHHHHHHHRMVIQAPVNSVPVSQPINYRLVSSADNLVDMVINVASYVEVVTETETDGDSKHSSSDNTYSPSKVNTQFAIDEERLASLKAAAAAPKVAPVVVSAPIAAVPVPKAPEIVAVQQQQPPPNDMAKWVRSEAARNVAKPPVETSPRQPPKKPLSVSANIQMFNKTGSAEAPKIPTMAATTSPTALATTGAVVATPHSVPIKIMTTTTAETKPTLRKSGDNKIAAAYHERFSSLDSLASTSSSSGISSSQASSLLDPMPLISQTGAATSVGCAEFDGGSYSSFGSNHSLITPADLQLIIEEADPPLRRPEAFVVVLQRESPECSVGVTLAGGADYETKEITIYRVLSNSPAYKDGRLRKGDRILSVNGLSMRGLTHRESVTVLKTPRLEVVMVVTRSESVRTTATAAAGDAATLAKNKRASLGSLTSLHEKPQNGVVVGNGSGTAATVAGAIHKSEEGARRKMAYHKLSQSLEMDLDMMSNEGSSIYDEGKSVDGADDSTGSSMGDDAVFGVQSAAEPLRSKSGEARGRIVEIYKDNCGLGLAIEGGLDSPSGHCPLTVKKVFMGGAAEKTGQVSVGDVIVAINDFNTEQVTRVQAWNYMKSLPGGAVRFCLA